jgi:hypothetical protein
MPLYEVAILHVDDDENEKLIYGPKPVVAASHDRARLKAIRELSDKEAEDLDALHVLVRPFCP